MPSTPPESPTQYEHPPLQTQKIAVGAYDPAFVESLRANGQLRSVGADWDALSADFPPQVTHVIYPNGDLERIGMS